MVVIKSHLQINMADFAVSTTVQIELTFSFMPI
jgi:hypothetical protein